MYDAAEGYNVSDLSYPESMGIDGIITDLVVRLTKYSPDLVGGLSDKKMQWNNKTVFYNYEEAFKHICSWATSHAVLYWSPKREMEPQYYRAERVMIELAEAFKHYKENSNEVGAAEALKQLSVQLREAQQMFLRVRELSCEKMWLIRLVGNKL